MEKNAFSQVFSTIMAIGLFSLVAAQGWPMGAFGGPVVPVADSSDEIAKKIIDSKKPVLVDFWAIWCGPCRMLNPTLKKLEDAYKGKVLFLKVNVDYNPRISSYFQVRGIPAVFILKDRKVIREFVGMQPESDYRTALNEVLVVPSAKDSVKVGDSAKGKKFSGN